MTEYALGFALGFGFSASIGYLFFIPSAFARSLLSGDNG